MSAASEADGPAQVLRCGRNETSECAAAYQAGGRGGAR